MSRLYFYRILCDTHRLNTYDRRVSFTKIKYMFRLSNNLPVTVDVVLPLGDHQVNSVEVVEIHEAVLPLWAIFIRYSEQQMNTVYLCQWKDYMFKT